MSDTLFTRELRGELEQAGKEREEGIALRAALNRRARQLLFEVRDTEGAVTITDAAQLLGISRQHAYWLLEGEGPKL